MGLINKKTLKQYVKDQDENLRVSEETYSKVEEVLLQLTDNAISRCQGNGRKTIKSNDY